MESCYAIKAYKACILIALTAIESSLKKEFGNKKSMKTLVKQSDYGTQLEDLREYRNSLVHDNDDSIFNDLDNSSREEELDNICIEAFTLVHSIYCEPQKGVNR